MPTTTPVQIGSTTSANGATRPTSDGYVVRYGVTVASDQPVGTYTAQVVFTLVAN
jgi:isocitrate dehydrogenase